MILTRLESWESPFNLQFCSFLYNNWMLSYWYLKLANVFDGWSDTFEQYCIFWSNEINWCECADVDSDVNIRYPLRTRKRMLMINRPKIGWWKFIMKSGCLLVRSSICLVARGTDGLLAQRNRTPFEISIFSVLFHSRRVLIIPASWPRSLNIGCHIHARHDVWQRTRAQRDKEAQTANFMGNLWYITIAAIITVRYDR